MDVLGLGVAGEPAGEEVVEAPVPRLHGEQVLQVGDERIPRIVDRHGLVGALDELLEPWPKGGHQQVQARGEMAVQGADGDAGVAGDLLEGGLDAEGGELCCAAAMSLSWLSRASRRSGLRLLDVGLAHASSLPGVRTGGTPPE